MEDYQINIPKTFIEFADTLSPFLVPECQTKGFPTPHGARGTGDFLELLARITIFHEIASKGKICNLMLVSGEGDPYDLGIKHTGKLSTWDVKASSFAPYRDGLRLFIIEEYMNKPITGYIQSFVHLHESTQAHLHVAGVISTSNPVFQQHKRELIQIPQADHPGIGIPIELLSSFQKLLLYADIRGSRGDSRE